MERAVTLVRTLYKPNSQYDIQQLLHAVMLQADLAAVETARSTMTALLDAQAIARKLNTGPNHPHPYDNPDIRREAEACNLLNALCSAINTSQATLSNVTTAVIKGLRTQPTITDNDRETLRDHVHEEVANRLAAVALAKQEILKHRNSAVDRMAKAMHSDHRTPGQHAPPSNDPG